MTHTSETLACRVSRLCDGAIPLAGSAVAFLALLAVAV